MSQMLKGIYFTIEEALAAIDNLKKQGIRLVRLP